MLPYFELTTLHLGPIPLQVWGSFVAAGILLGAWISARFARQQGLNADIVYSGATWLIIASFIGARILHVLAYEPGFYAAHPAEALMFWHGGFSIIGGFIGAAVGYALFVRHARINWIEYADAFIYGLPLGMACGRLGCFLIHDHPGTVTHFILGVRYPDGQVRHDHGLYESLQSLVLAGLFAWFYRRDPKRQPLFFAMIFLLWYGFVRFVLDFFRLVDVKYFGLTPAQYACAVMVIGGLFLFSRGQKRTT